VPLTGIRRDVVRSDVHALAQAHPPASPELGTDVLVR
jgi:hypothetical protein